MKSPELGHETLKQEGPKIELPQNPEIITKLQQKLKEYRQRMNTEMEENPYRAPELFKFTDTAYKIAVLERLLKDGVIDTWELSRELNKKDGGINAKLFSNACTVIEDYAKTGGKSVHGGTGLH